MLRRQKRVFYIVFFEKKQVIQFFGANSLKKDFVYSMREHRTVVLPNFQGLGFGSRMCDGVAELLSMEGRRLQSKTAHPKYGAYRDRSHLWKPLKTNHKMGYDATVPLQVRRLQGTKMYFSHVYRQRYERTEERDAQWKERWEALKKRVIIINKDHAYEYSGEEYTDGMKDTYNPGRKKKKGRG